MSLNVDIRHRLGAFGLDARFTGDGRLTALFGPSGSGKTTLVRRVLDDLSYRCLTIDADELRYTDVL